MYGRQDRDSRDEMWRHYEIGRKGEMIMNTYCDLCANKDHKETCRTCVSGILRTTTDGAVYSLPSNYSRVFKPIVPSLDADALKATITK